MEKALSAYTDDHIQKYFPRSLAKVKEMIREVRSLSDDVRH